MDSSGVSIGGFFRAFPLLMAVIANLGLTAYVVFLGIMALGGDSSGKVVGYLMLLVFCPLTLASAVPAVFVLRKFEELPPGRYWTRLVVSVGVAAIPWTIFLFFTAVLSPWR